jgi:opacity protein-like surface antigen
MKKRLLVAVTTTVLGTSAMAQSAFQGFYGQVATGFESNTVSGLNGTNVESNPSVNGANTNIAAANQTFGGAPLVIGVGYNFSVAPKWVLGLGVDYSALSKTSSNYNYTLTGADVTPGTTANGANVKLSNRYNIFIAPGYEIDKDKLVYLKAGYSSITADSQNTSSFTVPGRGTFTNAQVGTASTTSSGSQTVSGYLLGLGYKQMITKGLYGFTEANYMSYGKATFSSRATYADGSGFSTNSQSPSLSSYQLLVGVGYKF